MAKKNEIDCGGILGVVFTALIFALLLPALCYFVGQVSGWPVTWLFGDTLVNGLNYTLGTSYTKDMIPTIFGTLAMVGSFFCGKSSGSISRRD